MKETQEQHKQGQRYAGENPQSIRPDLVWILK